MPPKQLMIQVRVLKNFGDYTTLGACRRRGARRAARGGGVRRLVGAQAAR